MRQHFPDFSSDFDPDILNHFNSEMRKEIHHLEFPQFCGAAETKDNLSEKTGLGAARCNCFGLPDSRRGNVGQPHGKPRREACMSQGRLNSFSLPATLLWVIRLIHFFLPVI